MQLLTKRKTYLIPLCNQRPPLLKIRGYILLYRGQNLSCFLHLPNKHSHGNTSSLNYFTIKFLPNFNSYWVEQGRQHCIASLHSSLFHFFYIYCFSFKVWIFLFFCQFSGWNILVNNLRLKLLTSLFSNVSSVLKRYKLFLEPACRNQNIKHFATAVCCFLNGFAI